MEALDLQGLPSGGDSWTRTNGLPSVGQVRNSRDSALERRNLSFAHYASASLHPPLAALRLRAPIDVNDVLYHTGLFT